MLKFGEGKVIAYEGKANLTVVKVRIDENGYVQRYYVNFVSGKCGRTSLWYIPRCNIDCFLDGIGILYYNEKEPVFYK